jgi:hypothetical protein
MEHDKRRKDADKLLGQAIKPIDLVSYQEGAIVSRTIIDKGARTLTLFAFDEGLRIE